MSYMQTARHQFEMRLHHWVRSEYLRPKVSIENIWNIRSSNDDRPKNDSGRWTKLDGHEGKDCGYDWKGRLHAGNGSGNEISVLDVN
ncbi:hypothetical protein TMatcc_010196 [Talaromyces marneffei ATCC 18224]